VARTSAIPIPSAVLRTGSSELTHSPSHPTQRPQNQEPILVRSDKARDEREHPEGNEPALEDKLGREEVAEPPGEQEKRGECE
jgi:hypothetical protein